MRSGLITLVGRPNVGKSSIVNALVGTKVSIVSPKPQTTRDRIMGIMNEPDAQVVFIDTPGFLKPRTKLGEYMNKCIRSATSDVDGMIMVFDASKSITDQDLDNLNNYSALGCPMFAVLNKIDLINKEKLAQLLEKFNTISDKVVDIIPLSCKKKINLDVLKKSILNILPEGNAYFLDGEISDKPVSYMICEIIREKALLLLQDEVPHGLGVTMYAFDRKNKITEIGCDIICEKESHKQIIIGDNASMIKKIGSSARMSIEDLLGEKVYLKLFVKVREDWRNNNNIIRDVGYSDK